MTAKPNLDAILDRIAALDVPPTGSELRVLLDSNPGIESEIIDFVTDWIDMERSASKTPPSADELARLVDRTLSRIHQGAHDEARHAAIDDFAAVMKAAGHDRRSLEKTLGIDASILVAITKRLVRPATVPAALVNGLAEAISKVPEVIRDFLRQGPATADAHKAKGQVEAFQEDFAAIVRGSSLSDDQKARWLSERPDPELAA